MNIEPGKPIGNQPGMRVDKKRSARVRHSAADGAAKDGGRPGAANRDEIVLSSGAQMLQSIKKALVSIPDVREENVQALEEKVANGTYTVDAAKLAEKLLGAAR